MYVYNGKIFSSNKGKVVYIEDTVEVITAQDESKLRKHSNEDFADPDANMDAEENEMKVLVPKEGCEIYGRIDKVDDRMCRVKILAINENVLSNNTQFTGMIFKENVRDYDRDNLVMHHCFVPNDIIKARVLQEA